MLIVLEPVLHACFMLLLYTVLRTRSVAGADVAVWLVLGLTGYFTVQNVFQRSMGAVSANKALFAYRQVRPIDTVIVRAALETVMGLIILVSILIVLALFGRQIAPEYPMESILSFIGLILSGLGMGLIISVFSDLVPEFASLMNFIFKPLYLLSGQYSLFL